MAGYWIVHSSASSDDDAAGEYVALWGPVAAKYQAKIIAGGGRHQTPEGPDAARQLIIEFPSYEQAVACYDDPDYKNAMVPAQKAFKRQLVIVEGKQS